MPLNLKPEWKSDESSEQSVLGVLQQGEWTFCSACVLVGLDSSSWVLEWVPWNWGEMQG